MKSEIILKDFKCNKRYEDVYSNLKGKVRWCKDYLEKSSTNIYLSLYSWENSVSRSSSLEFTEDTTFCDDNLLVYVNGDTTLVYQVVEDVVYELLKSSYEQIKNN